MDKDKIIIGIDQSYKRTGITILKNKEILRIDSLDFNGCKTKTEKRKQLREYLIENTEELLYKNITVITERIRLKSKGFINENYIKSTGALVATILDVFYTAGVPVYSVDTRSWKSKIVGSSKPLENPYGINPEKYRTILYMRNNGLLKHIAEPYEGKGKKGIINVKIGGKKVPCKINDDKADSYCIALYGFLPEREQKLERIDI